MYTDKKRRLRFQRDEKQRLHYLALIHDMNLPAHLRLYYVNKLAALSKNGSRGRLKNHCTLTGRSKGVYRFCGLSRIAFRELASLGLMPGVVKSSW
uniref:Ribosomal protein S14 n=1 Tax=Chloroparvula japonica TaxID=1411623 RepID=A0A4D6C5Z2_9CHLO|nr:ribosomal protein S14 [Chloroparvula japonica]QBX98787.1 ribosomal protein S14 [Chloroparvula japonica]